MPQSLAKILVHTVFSTKDRRPLLRDKLLRDELHRYLGGILTNLECQPIIVGGGTHPGSGLPTIYESGRIAANLIARKYGVEFVSKNTEAVALEALDTHPGMVLRRRDFAGMRINWEDKAANVASLVHEIGLGLGSVVFIDDNPVERARVGQALPEVLVPEWPTDPMLFAQTLRALRCFSPAAMSASWRERPPSRIARIASLALGIVAVILGISFKGQNVAYMVGLAFAIAASGNFPALVLSIFWRRCTTTGAVASMLMGTFGTLLLIVISPVVQVDILKHESATFALRNPGIVTIPLSFVIGIVVSLMTTDAKALAAWDGSVHDMIVGKGD